MIITKLRLRETNPMITTGNKEWPLPYIDLNVDSYAGLNGYILRNCVGLGPPGFLQVVEGFDTNGVSVYTSFPEDREISARVSFNLGAGKSISELRSTLYKYISRSLRIELLNGSNIVAVTYGYISNVDTSHFSNDPDVEITIKCDYADFMAPESVSFVEASLSVASPILTYNEGDAPTGLDLHFKSTSATPIAGFTISNYAKFWHDGSTITNSFDLDFSILQNDEIFLSTHPQNKRLTLLRSAVTYDLAGYLNSGAVWPKLYPGVNTFTWDLNGAWVDWLSASYTPRFWGV